MTDFGPPLGVGCPMWANREWVGSHLPADTAPGRELEAYARVCNAVEGNTTFYAVPEAPTVARWRDATPEAFRFVLKVPRTITHDRRLRDVDDELRAFVDRFLPLRDRLGPCSIQLPGSFGPDDIGALRSFLAGLPSDLDWAVEVRHREFHAGGAFERPLNDLLYDHGVDRVILDSRAFFAGPRETPEEQEAWDNKPRLPVRAVATADQPIVRFIGRTSAPANPPFWEPWLDRVARWIADGRRPLVFLHTPDNAIAPALARAFHAAVVERVPRLEPLPTAPTVAEEVGLFDG